MEELQIDGIELQIELLLEKLKNSYSNKLLGGSGTSKHHCTPRRDHTSQAERQPKSQSLHSLLLGLVP